MADFANFEGSTVVAADDPAADLGDLDANDLSNVELSLKKALEEKDANEKVKIAELKEQGKKKLEELECARYTEQLSKAKEQNWNAEKEWIAERDNENTSKDWEKITKLCDFNPKTSRTPKDGDDDSSTDASEYGFPVGSDPNASGVAEIGGGGGAGAGGGKKGGQPKQDEKKNEHANKAKTSEGWIRFERLKSHTIILVDSSSYSNHSYEFPRSKTYRLYLREELHYCKRTHLLTRQPKDGPTTVVTNWDHLYFSHGDEHVYMKSKKKPE